MCYSKSLEDFEIKGVEIGNRERYTMSDEYKELRGPYYLQKMGMGSIQYSESLDYPIETPDGGIVYPIDNNSGKKACWRWSKNKLEWGLKNGFIVIKKDSKDIWTVYSKQYLKCDNEGRIIERTQRPFGVIDTFSSTQASKYLDSIGLGVYFNYSKPSELIKYLIDISSNPNSIILDFFSGSATTAHAVMQLNAEDGGSRKYIMVQLPEQIENAEYKNICEIGKERIRRAGKKIQEESERKILGLDLGTNSIGWAIVDGNKKIKSMGAKVLFEEEEKNEALDSVMDKANSELRTQNSKLDIGFRVYRLADSNMQDVYYRPQDYKQETLNMFADNIKPDRTPDDLLAQVMLDWGLPLSYRIEQIDVNGKQVFRVAQDSLLACFDKGIDEAFAKAVAKEKPLRVVFRDSGFASDTAKINVQQLLKQLSPETEMKVI